ncbi:MAG: FHA domain-containing protein [Anaerolineae bacterium]|nr:FHA domain-containing protein [Anaerolineae bacterium]
MNNLNSTGKPNTDALDDQPTPEPAETNPVGEGERPNETILISREEFISPHAQNRRAYFSRSMQLVLYIMETDTRIPVYIENYITLGREETHLGEQHLDLSAHNAVQLGVSRRHARLIRSTATVMIEDMSTLNGTYLNGVRLAAGQPAVLSDGDELRLGKMLMAVIFEKMERP